MTITNDSQRADLIEAGRRLGVIQGESYGTPYHEEE